MRGISSWALAAVPIAAWLACVLFPALGLVERIAKLPRTEAEIRSVGELLVTSVGWAAGIALGAAVIGWIPGRILGRALNRRGFVPLATLVLVPICLPAYVVFYAWWQSWPADTSLYRWIVSHDLMQAARRVTLVIGLLCWSWPLVSWCVAGATAQTPAEREEMLLIDGAGWARRWIDHLRCDARGLALGALLVFLATLANTTCFDLSEVFTYSNELRAVAALGANAHDTLVAGAPGMLIAGGCAVLVWMLLSGKPREAAVRARPASAAAKIVSAIIWIISVIVPLTLFTAHVIRSGGGMRVAREFFTLYTASVLNTIGLALVSGTLGAMIAIGMFVLWQDERRWVRMLANMMAAGWLIIAVMPGTIIGLALEAAYNRGSLAQAVYTQPLILIITHLACFGFVGALLARWTAWREPEHVRDMRRLDGAQTFAGIFQTTWPQLLGTGIGALAIIFVLAIGETPVTATVNPPMRAGRGPLALTLLNDMHYQRPQTVMIAALGMAAGAMLISLLVAISWRMLRTISSEGARS